MPLLANLNPEQLAAVTLPNQSALILAGAGSGKTRVLTTRIAWLIQTGNVSPAGILAVTFTNKAAKEMLTRISAMLPINTRGMWVGTFHGLCNRMLRAHYREAGLPRSEERRVGKECRSLCDWSSDVCSSDLHQRDAADQHAWHVGRHLSRLVQSHAARALPGSGIAEIGRASCRERV